MYYLEELKIKIAKKINEILADDLVLPTDLIYPPFVLEKESEVNNLKKGDISLTCFKLAKSLGKNPAEVADDLSSQLKGFAEAVDVVFAVGPYLNFEVNKILLSQNLNLEINKAGKKYGNNEKMKGKRIIVEYGQPNPFKAFHIGHLRGTILGESLCRLLEAQGAQVIRLNYQGDVGMHIAKCLWAFQEVDQNDYPKKNEDQVALLAKCYVKGASAFKDDPLAKKEIENINGLIYSGQDETINKLWQLGKNWSLEKFQQIFFRLNVHFQKEYMESEVMDLAKEKVALAKEKGILEESEGALVFKGEPYGLDTRVFVNSQGYLTYEGKELGLAFHEFNDFGKIDLCLHSVGSEQKSFFKATFKVEELLAEDLFKDKQFHNAYELVVLKNGKMSSRLGNVILGEDIINEGVKEIKKIMKEKNNLENIEETAEIVGVSAIKYSFLKVGPSKQLAFDLKESVSFDGDSAPYVLYTYVRIKSILEKADIDLSTLQFNPELLTENKEKNIIVYLAVFYDTIARASLELNPSELVKYVFELSRLFNDYYHKVPILKADEETKASRLLFLKNIAQIIENCLYLLGIKTVNKM